MNAEELRARLAEADLLDPDDGGPGGTGYVEAMRALVPHAEALGEPGLLFTVRLSFAWALRYRPLETGASLFFGEALPTLRRCLLAWHAEPDRFDDGDVRAMWNQLFLVVDAYIWLYPEPAARIHRFLDELERFCPPTRVWTRYAIEHYRMHVDARRGDVEAVDRRWRLLRAQGEPREHLYPDGKACRDAQMWQRLGRNDRALEALAPLAAGQLPTRDGAGYADDLLMPYLRAGRLAEAVAAHQRTYTRPDMKLGDVAGHLEFCARTGNEERGIEVLHRNRRYVTDEVASVEAMWTAAAAALLCRRVLARNLDREWIWPCGCDTPDCGCRTGWSFADLGSVLRWEVVSFAEKLDGLDGTGFQGERIRGLLAVGPVVDSLPLPAGPPYALPARDPGTATGERLALLADLVSRPRGRRHTLFTTLVELVRSPALSDAGPRDRIWAAVPTTLDRVLTLPAVHLAQIDALLTALEPHCRPGSGDLHCLRWFRVELEVRRGDVDAARAAWEAFAALPADARYATPANVRRRTLWWLDLGLDADAIASAAGDREREDYLLLPYLRTGRADEAREVHERTWQTTVAAPEAAAHLEYCARTGELAHATALIHRHLDLFLTHRDDSECSIDRVRAYGAATRLSERILSADPAADRDGTWTWPGASEPEWTYARFAAECRFETALFADRWDELTGTGATRALVAQLADTSA